MAARRAQAVAEAGLDRTQEVIYRATAEEDTHSMRAERLRTSESSAAAKSATKLLFRTPRAMCSTISFLRRCRLTFIVSSLSSKPLKRGRRSASGLEAACRENSTTGGSSNL